MGLLNQIWLRITNIGLHDTMDEGLLDKVKLINQILAFVFIVVFLSLPLYYFLGRYNMVNLAFFTMALMGSGLVVSYLKYHKFLLHYTIIISMVYLGFSGIINKDGSNFYIFIYSLIPLCYLLFKTNRVRIAYLILCMGLLVFIFSFSFNLFTPTFNLDVFFELYQAITNLVIIYIAMRFFDWRANKLLTRIKEHSDEVEKRETFYRGILEHAYDGVNVVDDNGYFKYISPSIRRILGYEPNELVGKKMIYVVFDHQKPIIAKFLKNLSNNHELSKVNPQLSVVKLVRKNGEVRYIQSSSINRLSHPSIRGIITNFRDITDQRMAQVALKKNEAMLQAILDSTEDRIYAIDTNLCLLAFNKKVNEAYKKHTGEDFVVGMDLTHIPTASIWKPYILIALEGQPISKEHHIQNGDIEIFLLNTYTPIFDDAKKVIGCAVFSKDITQIRRATQAVRRSENRFRNIFENSQIGIITVDDGMNITSSNAAFRRMIGYEKHEVKNLNIKDITPKEDLNESINTHKNLLQNKEETIRVEKKYIRKDGEIVYVQNSLSGLYDEDGKLTETIVMSVDITKRIKDELHIKSLLSRLEQSNEELTRSNQELQQFAYVASHDLQEPLRMVGNFVQLLEEENADKLDSESKMYIKFAVDGVTRMNRLIDDLLHYSRVGRKELKMTPSDVNEIVAVKIHDLSQRIKERNASVTWGELPNNMVCEPNQLSIVFFNLIANAIKFNKTRLPTVHIHCEERTHDWLFSIKDNGIGIAPENQEKIFEIFKRLHRKEVFQGTGIGLALVKRIILRHGGDIWLDSIMGEGTTFYFNIPKSIKT